MIQGTKISIFGNEVTLQEAKYSNDRLAITSFVVENGCFEPFGTLTINIPDAKLEESEIIIKNWSENVEFAKACFESGLFEDTGKRIESGYVQAPVWRIKENNKI